MTACAKFAGCLELNDAYLSDLKTRSKAHKATIGAMTPMTDENTVFKHNKAVRKKGSAKGGKAYAPLEKHMVALLKIYREQQINGNKKPNKSKLTEDYIKQHPSLNAGSFDRLRKSLPKHGK